jgi:hypothetical protein
MASSEGTIIGTYVKGHVEATSRLTVTTPHSVISNHRARLITPNSRHYSVALIFHEFKTLLHFSGIRHVIS